MIEKFSSRAKAVLVLGGTTLSIGAVGLLFYKGVVAPVPSADDLERACKSLVPGTGQMEVFQLLPRGKPRPGQLTETAGGGSVLSWSSKPGLDSERAACTVSFDSEGRVVRAQVIR